MNKIKQRTKANFFKNWYEMYGNFKCTYCKVDCLLHIKDLSNSATIDHIIPKCLGGTNIKSNLTLSCLKCNNEKSKLERIVLNNKPINLSKNEYICQLLK